MDKTARKQNRDGTKNDPIEAGDYPEAFEICREAGMPLVFCIKGEIVKCFPSGHAFLLKRFNLNLRDNESNSSRNCK